MFVRGLALLSFLFLAAAACASRQQTPSTTVSIESARQTALARVPGQVIEEELEDEDGRSVYEFDIQPSQSGTPVQEVVVDANTGQILKVEADD